MAKVKGRDPTVWVGLVTPGAGGTPTYRVRGLRNTKYEPKTTTADTETNDDEGYASHMMIGESAMLSFAYFVDRTDAGQQLLRQAQRNRTQIYVAYREEGDGSGRPQELFLASVSISRPASLKDVIEYSATLERSGIPDDAVQV